MPDFKSDQKPQFHDLSSKVIGCAIEVHRELGPGLLENAYEHCLSRELERENIEHSCQVALPIVYKGESIECGYRIDLIVGQELIIELKAVDRIMPIHEAQLLTYMKLSGVRFGLLINFNVQQVRHG